jgi:hypothetical protein
MLLYVFPTMREQARHNYAPVAAGTLKDAFFQREEQTYRGEEQTFRGGRE